MNEKVKIIIKDLDIHTPEHDYIIECLKTAVNYCKEQFKSSGIDWLPSAKTIGLNQEDEKFALLMLYLNSL
jgi:hypothetical protein